MEREKAVDESWKDAVENEKIIGGEAVSPDAGDGSAGGAEAPSEFMQYLSGLAFQALISLGEVPNPMNDNAVETHLPQAKWLIDTLALLRDKTQGNLTKPEEDFLNVSLYELQMKYVEKAKTADGGTAVEGGAA